MVIFAQIGRAWGGGGVSLCIKQNFLEILDES